MTFTPLAPTVHMPPSKVAADTFVVHQVQPALGQPLFVYLNSMVILGSEPVIVDTGTPANRDQWLDDVFSLVEPKDVRWIFLSHDDVDHSGNLDEVMTRCPNAHLVCNWAMVERHTNCFDFPLERCRWIMHEESFSGATVPFTRYDLRSTTHQQPGGSSIRSPGSTGPSTRSPRRSRMRRWVFPISIRTSGTRAWRCSPSARSPHGSRSSITTSSGSTSTGSRASTLRRSPRAIRPSSRVRSSPRL